MALVIIAFIVSIIASALTYILPRLYEDISYIWVIFVSLIVYFVVFIVLDLIVTIFCAQFYSLKKQVKKPNKFFLFQMVNASEIVLFFVRAKVKVIGKEKLPKNSKKNRFLLVFNHMSNYDHLAMMSVLKRYEMVSISKPELENIPIVGKVQHAAGFIPIDRENAFNALRSIKEAVNFINKGYASVAVNPEGKRNKDGQLGEFHPLLFSMINSCKCPIVVASIKNSNKIKENSPKRKTIVEIEFIDVLYPQDYENMNYRDLCNKTHEIIKNNLGQ